MPGHYLIELSHVQLHRTTKRLESIFDTTPHEDLPYAVMPSRPISSITPSYCGEVYMSPQCTRWNRIRYKVLISGLLCLAAETIPSIPTTLVELNMDLMRWA